MSDDVGADARNGEPWSEMDVRDLRACLSHRHSIEEAASLLGRAGTLAGVWEKANELGLTYESRPLQRGVPMHKITKAELVELGPDHYGVALEFDDGFKQTISIGDREDAEYAARDRIGNEVPVPGRF